MTGVAAPPQRCVYCGGEDPPTAEHVLQDAFGTSLVLEAEVCGPCNNRFSALDKELVEYVHKFEANGHPGVRKPLSPFRGARQNIWA